MKYLFALVFLIPFSIFAETVKVHVPGMVCQMCVQGMQKQFQSVVKDVEMDIQVNLDTKTVTVKTVAPIEDSDIKERVKNAGYNVKKITRTLQD